MKKCQFMISAVIGLSIIMTSASTLVIIPVQLAYSSPEQQSDDEQQDEPINDEPADEPEPNPEPETPSEDLPVSDEQGETTAAQEPVEPEAEREVCVTNAKGQKFCYKELKPDEVCMKPINEEDPPICPPPKTEGIVNGTSGNTGNPLDVEMATTADPTADTVSEGIAINEKGKPADCLVKKTKC